MFLDLFQKNKVLIILIGNNPYICNNSKKRKAVMAILLHKNPVENVVKHSLNNMTEAKNKLWQRLSESELSVYNFQQNVKSGAYHFDFYSSELNLGIQLDAYSYCFEETYNSDQIKTFRVGYKSIKVVKLTDYQVMIDMDQVMRYLKFELSNKSLNKLIA